MYRNILFVFQGLGLAGFKNPAISPLFITMTGVMIFACAYCIRSLTRNSDASWQKEETPQNRTMGQQFNMLSIRALAGLSEEGETIQKKVFLAFACKFR